ncbi:MAG: helix-hairpin-helix domain-containing protein, partial [Bacteroidales bacterium]|nr:helix-hairpin-helix domain-containing protein [Bacteroidales bacterium]
MKKFLTFLLSVLTAIFSLKAQQPEQTIPSDIREVLMEAIAAANGEQADFESLLLELEQRMDNPVNLNTAGADELRSIPFLTEFQVASLIDYRNRHGQFLSVYELQVVYGFTPEVISLLLPFVCVVPSSPARLKRNDTVVAAVNHKLWIRTQRTVQKARGYRAIDPETQKPRYPGSPWLLNVRYGAEWNKKYSAGVTLEKDPGETLFSGSNRAGFDYYSAHIMVRDVGALRSLVVGDYRLAFGQGLTLWNGMAPGKSSLPLNIVKRQDAIKAYASNDENNYFRGSAASISWKRIMATGFFSSKSRDANIVDTLEDGGVLISSFQESGYHRTIAEVEDEKSVRETVAGGNLLYRGNHVKVGTTLLYTWLNKEQKRGDDPDDRYDFAGDELLNWGVDYSLVIKRLQCFGETSMGNGYLATVNGLLMNVNKYASFSLLYRNYAKGYFSFHSSAFSEGSPDANESGFYAGMILHPFPNWKISGYADFYRFPWLRGNLPAPASGSDYLLQADYKPAKSVAMYLRLKAEWSPVSEATVEAGVPRTGERRYTGLRYHISYRVNRKLEMQNRMEWVQVDPSDGSASQGYMVYHDASYRFGALPMRLDCRLAWFSTGDY